MLLAAGATAAMTTAPVASAAARTVEVIKTPDPRAAYAVIDTRPHGRCERASFPGARCLNPTDVFGPHDRLANISGLLWALGSAGLAGSERVLVVGDRPADRDAIAGLLFIAGQSRIDVLSGKVRDALKNRKPAPGTPRSTTREVVFQAPMRSTHIVLRRELLGEIRSNEPPLILDGRSDAEYWGADIRASRGGHIPGAVHAPMAAGSTIAPIAPVPEKRPIAYGNGPRDSLAYLVRLQAAGIDARIYLEGWSGWASDGALPADAMTFAVGTRPGATTVTLPASRASPSQEATTGRLRVGAVAFLSGVIVTVAGFWAAQAWRSRRTG